MIADNPISWFILVCVAFYYGYKLLVRCVDEFENKYK